MKYVMLILALGLFGCTSSTPGPSPIQVIGCSAETSATSALAAFIGMQGVCSNLSAIQGDIQSYLGKANLCAAAVVPATSKGLKGPIGNVICPLAVNSVLGVIGSKVPATWGCSVQDAPSAAALSAACSKAIGI